jgi:predicted ATPase with chaperone activity
VTPPIPGTLTFSPNKDGEYSAEGNGFSCILKIARTIADLEGFEDIATYHISEAIQYRSPDRTLL